MTQLMLPTSKECDFAEFDRAHPEVFDRFRSKARELLSAGHEHYSARTIFEVLRWESDLNPNRDGGFKIDNTFIPKFARKLIEQYPEFEGFFELRSPARARGA